MDRHRERFAAEGAPLVMIGQGTPANAAAFRKRFGLAVDLLVDTDRRAYKAAGTKVGSFSELLGPRVVARGVRRALGSGIVQGRVVGHPAQLGGLMLVVPGGAVVWAHLSTNAGDYPPSDDLLEAVRSALPKGPHAA